MMGWSSLVRWVSRHLTLGKRQLVRPQEAVGHSGAIPGGVSAETLRDAPETRKVPPEDGQVSSQASAAEAENRRYAAKTQFAGYGTERADLIVGLDFGTLSTRVVVRSPYVGDGRAVPVRWRVRRGLPPHFLPAALHNSANGELTLASDWNEFEERNLKIDLMDHPEDLTARARAAAYLGLVLLEARAYVLETQEQAYGAYRLRWAVHVGIPSAGYDDHRVKTAFLCVARAAWILSCRSESPTLETATAVLERAWDTEASESDPDVTGVEVYPEIAALVVGYARSRRRREGLHVMVDVGASTIDVCGFGLRNHQGDDKYSLYTALVERIGIRELHRRRMDAIRGAHVGHLLRAPGSPDPFWEVPVAGAEYVSAPSAPLRVALDRLDECYVEDCTRALMKVLMDLRRWRDPHSASWMTGLPLFKAGGGAQHGLITRALRQANQRLTRATPVKGIDEEPLPSLETLDDHDSSPEDYGQGGGEGPVPALRSRKRRDPPGDGHLGGPDDMAGRLGVAYGLSFDKFEIGDIVPPHEIDDVPAMPQSQPAEYISKEHM